MLDFRYLGSEDGSSTELSRTDLGEDLHTRGGEYFNTLAIIIIIIIIAIKRIKIYKLFRQILFFDD